MLRLARNLLAVSALALATSNPARSAAVNATAGHPAVTIYSHDLGLVRERRALELAGTRDTVRLTDLPERIDFGSLRLVPAARAHVTRLAYRFDVASGDGLIDRARGRRVRISEHGDRVREGLLVAADPTWLVIRGDDGTITTLSRTAVEEVRLIEAPAGLTLRPTLEAAIEGGARGRSEAELSYLTGGLSWSAEHVVVRHGEREVTWSAAAVIENTSGRDFVDAELALVAGDPQRIATAPPPMPMRATLAMAGESAKQADLSEEAFSEYHLYTLGHPATLRDRESQSLTMLEPRTVRVTPRYLYRGGDARGVIAQLEVTNSKEAGLGVPLAGGRVRFYEADASGGLQFIGENRIRHTAAGEKLTMDLGVAFDLAAERRTVSERRISDRERETSVEIQLRNRKDRDVTIVIEEPISGEVEVTKKTHEFTRKDANTLQFVVPVPAGKEVTVAYTAHVTY